ncbi:MAG: Ig-like domain repeat protein [Holophagales bacterium]|nr:Ig-like domain repeat protein [Holophagales bacterium]
MAAAPPGAGGGSDGSGGPFAGYAGTGQGGGGAGLGGAIFVSFGSLYVSNSTFHSNGAFGGLAGGPGASDGRGAGGAIFLLLSGLQMNHGTVTGSSGEGSIFSQIDLFFGPDAPEGIEGEILLFNSIVADHTDPLQPNCIVECDDCGAIDFGANNLDNSNVGNDCVGTTQTGDPLLDALAIYPPGVPTPTPLTPTRRLQSGSPAIDNADADACLATDQRGVVRPQLLGCDIGAYERDTFPTTTTLVCAPNPSLYTQLVTCTATVAATEGGTPAGDVAFAVDAGPVGTATLDGSGQASFSTSILTVGVHQVDADYLGSPVHDPSSAAPFFQTVDPIPTTTALVCAPNPSTYTELVTCTATVTATFGALVPTGTITFAVDAAPMAPVALDGAGQASFSTSSLTVGNHAVDASYNGATEFLPSVAPQVVQVVQPIPTATTVACAPDPSFYAQEVVCTATVVSTFGALVPVGNVAIGFDGAPAPTQPLDGAGQASRAVSDLEVGEHAVIASYPGSTNFAPSVSPQFDQTVVKIPTATTLDVAPNPALVGSTVGFTATVVKTEPFDGLPTGDVVFSIDGVDEPPVPIDGAGVAILFKAADDIGPGEHQIGARYLGEPHFEESAAVDVVLRIATIQEIPTLDASGLAALILLLAAGALTILVRRRTGHRR